MKIDVHAHFYPPRYLAEAGPLFAADASPGGQDIQRVFAWAGGDPRMSSVERRLQDMDSFGVDTQVLSLSIPNVYLPDAGAAVGQCQAANDLFIEMARGHPGRFKVFASLPMQQPKEAMRELERVAGSPEVVGVILGANVAGTPLNHPDFLPVYAELEQRRLPFFIHPMRPPGVEWMTEFRLAALAGYLFDTTIAAARLVFAGVFERHPDLVMIMPHVGGTAPYIMGRINWGYQRNDVCREHISAPPEEYFKRFYYDTVCHSLPALQFVCSMFGTGHVVFGTDFPFADDVEHQQRLIESLKLPAEEEQAVFGGNAARILSF